MAAVKIGVSRQVVIPKKIHDTLGLAPGDYLEVAVERGKVVMTPKALVDKRLEKRLAESFEDFRKGRTSGPFSSAKEAIRRSTRPRRGRALKPRDACALLGALSQELRERSPRHPSLRAKKYDETRDLWQARVTRGWRFYFTIEGDTYRLHDIIAHPK